MCLLMPKGPSGVLFYHCPPIPFRQSFTKPGDGLVTSLVFLHASSSPSPPPVLRVSFSNVYNAARGKIHVATFSLL